MSVQVLGGGAAGRKPAGGWHHLPRAILLAKVVTKGIVAFVGLAATNPTPESGDKELEGSMSTVDYLCEVKSIDAFLAQLVRYVASGHWFYVRCRIPAGKDPQRVDEKLLRLYDIRRPRWQRKRRHLKDNAGIHYLRYDRLFVILLTKGRHDAFYRDHGDAVLDIRRTALKAFGYSVRWSYAQTERRWCVHVRLDKENYRQLKTHLVTLCTWPAYRLPEALERRIHNLPYQRYAPVRQQLYTIAKAVNRVRRRAGLAPVDYRCIAPKMRITKVFSEDAAAVGSIGSSRPSD